MDGWHDGYAEELPRRLQHRLKLMKKLLLTLALGASCLTASAAQHIYSSLLNGNAVVVTNNTTLNWSDTNAYFAGDQLANSTMQTPFPQNNGTNNPSTNYFSLPASGYPIYNWFQAQNGGAIIWGATNYGTGVSGNTLYSNIWRTDLTNTFGTNTLWVRDVQPQPDAYMDGNGVASLTFGTIGNLGNSSNTVAITLVKACKGTNYGFLTADSFTITITNGLTATLNSITPLVQTYWNTNLPTAFLQNAKAIRISKIVTSSIGSSGYITVFDAGISQWSP